jgi:hypothetical protein
MSLSSLAGAVAWAAEMECALDEHVSFNTVHSNLLCMYLRNQQLAVAVSSETPSRYTITDEPRSSITFNLHHSAAQLAVSIHYLFYPLELAAVVLCKMLVIHRMSDFLRKVANEVHYHFLSLSL